MTTDQAASPGSPPAGLGKLRLWAERVLVMMMGLMFITFIAQVLFRYALNLPLAWSEELVTYLWLWGILWGAALVTRNRDEMRFDLAYNLMPRAVKRWSTVIVSVLFIVILVVSLPATWKYISFMHVERSPAFRLPMSLVFGIYLLFALALIVRHAHIAWSAVKGNLVEDDFGSTA